MHKAIPESRPGVNPNMIRKDPVTQSNNLNSRTNAPLMNNVQMSYLSTAKGLSGLLCTKDGGARPSKPHGKLELLNRPKGYCVNMSISVYDQVAILQKTKSNVARALLHNYSLKEVRCVPTLSSYFSCLKPKILLKASSQIMPLSSDAAFSNGVKRAWAPLISRAVK